VQLARTGALREHLKNDKGYLGGSPIDAVAGWRVQFEQNAIEGFHLYLTPVKGNGRSARAAARRALEPCREALPDARPQLRTFSDRKPRRSHREVAPLMSAVAKPEKTKKDLSGLMPYLKRYKSGIVIGLSAWLSCRFWAR